MTKLSNVPMQLNPTAVEPLTLIEKLQIALPFFDAKAV